MKRYRGIVIAVLALCLLASCSKKAPDQSKPGQAPAAEAGTTGQDQEMSLESSNPFSHESPLPYHAPEYDRIRPEHFVPAMKVGMAQERAEIEKIAGQTEEPTFENTIVALQKTGRLLARVNPVFSNFAGAFTNDVIKAAQVELAPLEAAHDDAIMLNEKLFARVEKVYEARAGLGLDPESLRLVEKTYENFVRAGARLTPEQKARVREINAELSTIGTKFGQNILSEMNDSAVIVATREELDGLSEEQIEAAASRARELGQDGKFAITLVNTSIQPVLASLNNRELRKRVHEASLRRGMRGNEADNRDLVARVLALKSERAKMLGYPNYAAFKIANQCARTTDAVNAMMSSMVPAALASLNKEAEELQALIDRQKGGFKLEAWDWFYYAEKLRKEKYNIDDAQLKPYFELNTVITKGVFYAAEKLYGIKMVERKDFPVYDPDVRVWEVFDEDGTAIGLFYGDYYARPNKRGGAWASRYVSQSHLLGERPVALNQINIPEPASGPTLMTVSQVTTVFHEFGHALHSLFSDVRYPQFTGTSVPRDFVEFPSQFNETWAFHPEILDNYAVHYETGEKLPREMVDRVIESQKFNQGYMTTEFLAAAMLDQAWFQADPVPELTPATFEEVEHRMLAGAGLDLALVPPRYRTTYFNHIFASGYDAGYYAYIWSEVLDADAEAWFHEHGLLRENGKKYRDAVLSKGGSAEPMDLYRNFTGREPSSEHLMVRRGLK